MEEAGATYPVAIDAHNMLGARLGYRVVPNGILFDEAGNVLYQRIGGFKVGDGATLALLRRLIAGEKVPDLDLDSPGVPLGALEAELVDTHFRLGQALYAAGDPQAAVREWRRALWLDPENYCVRKQIWAVEYPDRFAPVIDHVWQREQLARERAEEERLRAEGCGPDGCPPRPLRKRPAGGVG